MPEKVYTTPLLDKLGVKRPDMRVALVEFDDADLRSALAERAAVIAGPEDGDLDIVLTAVRSVEDLERLADLRPRIRQDGAIWVLREKGSREIRDTDVIDAGLRHGLVDNKIAAYSERWSAMRLVIRLRDRR